jgi:hypothetical protein
MLQDIALLEGIEIEGLLELGIRQTEEDLTLFNVIYVTDLFLCGKFQLQLGKLHKFFENHFRYHLLVGNEIIHPESQSFQVVPSKLHLEGRSQLLFL